MVVSGNAHRRGVDSIVAIGNHWSVVNDNSYVDDPVFVVPYTGGVVTATLQTTTATTTVGCRGRRCRCGCGN